eukprot:TRINITY_DN28023_c0_g1_i1.p1 TRINITY_DN28023_c0_g1~~TRINITY_DN28023_c0_g1_i1.p1  ORF type:complete len:965 (-),score=91.58 TRINITY_DN28023_c0_g1_i1:123-3017(-)
MTDIRGREDGFDRLLQLRQVAVRAECRESDAIAAMQMDVRRGASLPQWARKRNVPQCRPSSRSGRVGDDVSYETVCNPLRCTSARTAKAASSCTHPTSGVSSAQTEESTMVVRTKSGWGDLGTSAPATSSKESNFPSSRTQEMQQQRHLLKQQHEQLQHQQQPMQSSTCRLSDIDLEHVDRSRFQHVANVHTLRGNVETIHSRTPIICGSDRRSYSRHSAVAHNVDTVMPASLSGMMEPNEPSYSSLRPHQAVSRNADHSSLTRVVDGGRRKQVAASVELRRKSALKREEDRAALAALQQASVDEDDAILRELTAAPRHRLENPDGSDRGYRNNVAAPPCVPKVTEEPPSLRAWRRQRLESGINSGISEEARASSSQEETRRQVQRMKASLNELQDEVRQLQDLMEEDALELVENVRTIRTELRSRRINAVSTPATTLGPSLANSSPSTAAPSMPSSPACGSRANGPPGPGEIRMAMLRAAAATSSVHTAETKLQTNKVVQMRPVPQWVLQSFAAERLSSGTAAAGAASVFAAHPQVAKLVVEGLASKYALDIGSTCRAISNVLHTSAGRRIWPHAALVIAVGGSRPQQSSDDRVRAFCASVCWESLRSLSVYGASDSSVVGILDGLFRTNVPQWPTFELLRFRCSSQGGAAAITKRRVHGDFAGLGDSGAGFVLSRVQHLGAGRSSCRLRSFDLAWNHIGDETMSLLANSWPVGLESLCLDWNCIGEAGAAHLARGLSMPAAAAHLRWLDLRSNPLRDAGVVAICKALVSVAGSCLTWLGIGETMLTDAGAASALRPLIELSSLIGIDISENELTDDSCTAIADFLAHAPSLRRLLLRGFLFEPRRITDVGGKLLADAINRRSIVSVESAFELELDYQQVGCGTAVALAQSFHFFLRLSLFNTDVSTLGAMTLAKAFRQKCKSATAVAARTRLNVAQCRIGAGAVEQLRGVGFKRLDSHGQRS